MPNKKLIVNGKWLMGIRTPYKLFKEKLCLLTINYQPAFTLIELIVVIALIGILASIGGAGFVTYMQNARDAKRKNDLEQVRKALESARNDCRAGSYYPSSQNPNFERFRYAILAANVLTGTKNYMESRPYNPTSQTSGDTLNPYAYGYNYVGITPGVCSNTGASSGVKNYILRAKLEKSTDVDSYKSYTKCKDKIDEITNDPSGSWEVSVPTDGGGQGDGYFYVCND